MRTKLLFSAMSMALALTGTACSSSSSPRAQQTGGSTSGGSAAGVSYTGWVQTYLTNNCVSCHKVGGSATPDLSSYTAAVAGAAASLADMQSGKMPQGSKAAAADIASFQAWVSAGTPQNAVATTATGTGTAYVPPGTTTPTTTTPTASYDGGVSAYLTSACVSCHTIGGSATPDLSSYAAAKAQASAILSSMQTTMPQGGARPTADQLALIQAWVNAGAPQDAAATGGTTGTIGGVPTGTTGAVTTGTYASDIQRIFQTNCLSCHSSGGTQPDLTTLQNAQRYNDKIGADVVTGRMPTSGTMTDADRLKVAQWVDTGAY